MIASRMPNLIFRVKTDFMINTVRSNHEPTNHLQSLNFPIFTGHGKLIS